MKTKINFKKGVLLFTVVSMLIGCGINVIPVLVTKDITLAKVTIFGLQDKWFYTTSSTVDLTKMVDEEDLNALTSAKIKGFTLKIGNDYENTVTNSKKRKFIFAVAVQRGLKDNVDHFGNFSPTSGDEADVRIEGNWGGNSNFNFAEFDSSIQNSEKYTFTNPLEIANYIVDGKLTLNIHIGSPSASEGNFNDSSFSFDLSVATEVEVEL